MTEMRPDHSHSSSDCRVVVLLPVYNGARYLAEQLDSILAQSLTHLTILCRDDGSSDGSIAVLRRYASQYPQRFQVLDDELGNLGARANFSKLMQAALNSDASPAAATTYYALSDQDDVWHVDKLAQLVAAMRHLEQGDNHLPALVHSDLRVVDDQGQVIAPSMAAYQGLRPDRDSFAAQLISNTVTGCTALMNRALMERSTPVPPQSIMHDWWISLVASAFGKRTYLQQPLLDYRQHANNTIGAKEWVKPVARRFFISRILDDRHHEQFVANARQAAAFSKHFAGQLGLRQHMVLVMARGLAVHYAPFQRVLFRVLRWL
ncbi:MAG: glycosyltransferase family 2 protein [Comamonadaceae bacterium]|nr:glycosyltransferase family 2 protein [Comamonadaceae bacterium]